MVMKEEPHDDDDDDDAAAARRAQKAEDLKAQGPILIEDTPPKKMKREVDEDDTPFRVAIMRSLGFEAGVPGGSSSSSSARPLQIHISDEDDTMSATQLWGPGENNPETGIAATVPYVPDPAGEVSLEESFEAEIDAMIEMGLLQEGLDSDSD